MIGVNALLGGGVISKSSDIIHAGAFSAVVSTANPITIPAGLEVGDLLIHVGYQQAGGTTATAPTVPSGWTRRVFDTQMFVDTKTATSGDVSTGTVPLTVAAIANNRSCVGYVKNVDFIGATAIIIDSSSPYFANTAYATQGDCILTIVRGNRDATAAVLSGSLGGGITSQSILVNQTLSDGNGGGFGIVLATAVSETINIQYGLASGNTSSKNTVLTLR